MSKSRTAHVGRVEMRADLVQVHHAAFQRDIPFWLQRTEGRDPILEVGCGHGRLTLPLLEEGHQVVGVDNDPAVLEILKHRLHELPENFRSGVKLVKKDILQFDSGTRFGAVLIPCNTLTTFDADQRQQLFSLAGDMLIEGGQLIASMPNPVQLLNALSELQNREEEPEAELEEIITHPETGFPVQVSSRMLTRTNTLVWEWIYDQLLPDGNVERVMVSSQHFPAERDSFTADLMKAGFTTVEYLGDFDGSKFEENSPELILAADR